MESFSAARAKSQHHALYKQQEDSRIDELFIWKLLYLHQHHDANKVFPYPGLPY
jgi:hypothetical protein